MAEQIRRTEKKGGLERFVPKSQLMKYLLAGLISLTRGDHPEKTEEIFAAPDQATTEIKMTPEDEFASREKPLRPLIQETAPKPPDVDPVQKYGLDKFGPNLTQENLSEIYKIFLTANFKEESTLIRYFHIEGAPEVVASQKDVDLFIKATDQLISRAASEGEAQFIQDIAFVHLKETPPTKITLTIDGVRGLEEYGKNDFILTALDVDYEFENLPLTVDKSTLEKIVKILDKITLHNEDDPYLFIRNAYLRQMEFSEEMGPKTVSPETEQDALKAFQELNKFGYKEFVFETGDGEREIFVSHNLGVAYLMKCGISGYDAVNPSNPQSFIDTMDHFTDLDQPLADINFYGINDKVTYHTSFAPIGTDPFYSADALINNRRPFTDLYLKHADMGSMPDDLTGQDILQLIDFIQIYDAHWAKAEHHTIMGVEEVFLERKLFSLILEKYDLTVITPENLPSLLRYLKKAGESEPALGSKEKKEVLAEIFSKTLTIKGSFDITVTTDENNPKATSLEQFDEVPAGWQILDNFKHSAQKVSVVLNKKEFTSAEKEELGKTYDLLRAYHDNVSPNFDIEDALKSVRLQAKEFHVEKWEDLEHVGDPWQRDDDPSRVVVPTHILMEHLELEKFPVFSARYENLQTLKDNYWWGVDLYGDKLLERADFSEVPFAVTLSSLDEVAKQYQEMQRFFGDRAAAAYLKELEFPEFPQEVSEQNIVEIAAALRLLKNTGGEEFARAYADKLRRDKSLIFTYDSLITNNNLETEYAKWILFQYHLVYAEYPESEIKINITLNPPQSSQDFFATLNTIEMIKSIHEKEGAAVEKQYYESVDWQKVISDIDLLDIEKIEKIRQGINAAIGSTAGDKFLIAAGSAAIEKEPVSWENMEEKIKFCEAYLQADKEGMIDYDVVGMYQMIGMFQVSRLLEFWQQEDTGLSDERVLSYIERLNEAGADIPVEESAWQKAWRSKGSPGYVIGKGMKKIAPNTEVLRTAFREIKPELKPRTEPMKKGYEFQSLYSEEELIADILIGNPEDGAKVDFAVRVGGGLTEARIQEMYPKGSVAAEAVGSSIPPGRKNRRKWRLMAAKLKTF